MDYKKRARIIIKTIIHDAFGDYVKNVQLSTKDYREELNEITNAILEATAAPTLYEACKEQHKAIDILFTRLIGLDHSFFPSKSGQPWSAVLQGKKALAKAEGK